MSLPNVKRLHAILMSEYRKADNGMCHAALIERHLVHIRDEHRNVIAVLDDRDAQTKRSDLDLMRQGSIMAAAWSHHVATMGEETHAELVFFPARSA